MGIVSAASTTTAGPRPPPHITSLFSRTDPLLDMKKEGEFEIDEDMEEMMMGDGVEVLTSP